MERRGDSVGPYLWSVGRVSTLSPERSTDRVRLPHTWKGVLFSFFIMSFKLSGGESSESPCVNAVSSVFNTSTAPTSCGLLIFVLLVIKSKGIVKK